MMNDRRKSEDGIGELAQLSSISESGLVFHSSSSLVTGAEVRLSVQTHVDGRAQEWTVKGWVVGCQPAAQGEEEGYEVTLLFSQVPRSLKMLLGQMKKSQRYAYPPVEGEEFFGLN